MISFRMIWSMLHGLWNYRGILHEFHSTIIKVITIDFSSPFCISHSLLIALNSSKFEYRHEKCAADIYLSEGPTSLKSDPLLFLLRDAYVSILFHSSLWYI